MEEKEIKGVQEKEDAASGKIGSSLFENMQYFHDKLQVDKNFDIIYKMTQIGRASCRERV